MYDKIKKNIKVVDDDIEITTYTKDINSANTLTVEVGTTGYMGGDSGHGCRTYFSIIDGGSTDIKVFPRFSYKELISKSRNSKSPIIFLNDDNDDEDIADGFDVILGGDCELETIIRGLKFITKTLEDQANKKIKNK